jgi:repressor LexA
MANRIKELRLNNKLTLLELAEKLGVSESTVQRYESGRIVNIKYDTMEKLANILGVEPDYLMGWNDRQRASVEINNAKERNFFHNKLFKDGTIPVLGTVPCGSPMQALDLIDMNDVVEIEKSLSQTGEYYGLRAKGTSMLPKIEEGDIMIIHAQSNIESGQVAIVRVNGDEATCKRIKKYRDGVELIGINPTFEPRFFSNEEIISKPVEIVGRVIEVRSKL